jgi:hypothetical protein
VREQKDADGNEDDSNGKAQAQEDAGIRVLSEFLTRSFSRIER